MPYDVIPDIEGYLRLQHMAFYPYGVILYGIVYVKVHVIQNWIRTIEL